MKILWLTWKDRAHPLAGGAEIVNEELAKRLAKNGHEVLFLVGGYPGGTKREERDGFTVVRVGGRLGVYFMAYRYYKKNLADWPDLVVDEVNTIPFFASLYVKQKNILFIHQLAREIWFYEMFFPLSLVGYLLEPLYLRLLASRVGKKPDLTEAPQVVTVSQSSKRDLMRHGFKPEHVSIISEGIELEPLSSSDFSHLSSGKLSTLASAPRLLALGSIRPMKKTLDIVKAFEHLKPKVPSATLVVAGNADGAYGAKVAAHIRRSPYANDIEVLGGVTREQKIALLKSCHLLLATSLKEGWGLVVTEANSQGTPAVVYDADGLRDSVRNGETGLICKENTPQSLALKIEEAITNPATYESLREEAWRWSQEITFEKSYTQFAEILNHA